jgi:hypothetical protein
MAYDIAFAMARKRKKGLAVVKTILEAYYG